jgi:hypothetical protein
VQRPMQRWKKSVENESDIVVK